MDNIIITGYGAPDLIKQLKKEEWTPFGSNGRNFKAISLGGYCLTDTINELCNVRHRLTINNIDSKEKFFIEGFSFKSILFSFSASVNAKDGMGPFFPSKFAGHVLSENKKNTDNTFYTIKLEVLSKEESGVFTSEDVITSKGDTKEDEFIFFDELAIELMKKAIKGNLTNINSISMIYFFYGPGKLKAPKEACQDLIDLMRDVFVIYKRSLSAFIPYWCEQARDNLLEQLQEED
ncbi:MAG: hypothetical protein HQ538_04570 [Parcubacteria group bacterium]|nr:hypothetical protein [Parcubacteria group bacterium]